jgi:hypothetical protein
VQGRWEICKAGAGLAGSASGGPGSGQAGGGGRAGAQAGKQAGKQAGRRAGARARAHLGVVERKVQGDCAAQAGAQQHHGAADVLLPQRKQVLALLLRAQRQAGVLGKGGAVGEAPAHLRAGGIAAGV